MKVLATANGGGRGGQGNGLPRREPIVGAGPDPSQSPTLPGEKTTVPARRSRVCDGGVPGL